MPSFLSRIGFGIVPTFQHFVLVDFHRIFAMITHALAVSASGLFSQEKVPMRCKHESMHCKWGGFEPASFDFSKDEIHLPLHGGRLVYYMHTSKHIIPGIYVPSACVLIYECCFISARDRYMIIPAVYAGHTVYRPVLFHDLEHLEPMSYSSTRYSSVK